MLGTSSSALAAKKKPTDPVELTNFRLSPDLSQWLVGPIALIANEEEVRTYLGLDSDQQASEFIQAFWEKRGGDAVWPNRGQKLIFEERAGEADRMFGERTIRGRRTDRGTIHVLYGAPEEVRYESPQRKGMAPLEVWMYPKDREEGLDGKQPDRIYRFVEKDGLTVLYRGPVRRSLIG